MNEAEKKQTQEEMDELHRQYEQWRWPVQHWRAWGSWFSWGSPVGLGLFIALTMLSIGTFIWLINL